MCIQSIKLRDSNEIRCISICIIEYINIERHCLCVKDCSTARVLGQPCLAVLELRFLALTGPAPWCHQVAREIVEKTPQRQKLLRSGSTKDRGHAKPSALHGRVGTVGQRVRVGVARSPTNLWQRIEAKPGTKNTWKAIGAFSGIQLG